MIIRTMTATFGKLERATLVLEPGFGIIEAPNEWGKSTWCAFLSAMFYGVETRSHSTKNVLSPKERFQPWSGSPMEGRIDLVHEGRAITIERSTKGRIPMGQFRAYETESGLPVTELTADNCGQMLLGVEKDVFLRCAFVRQGDLPVQQSDALRRKLNALVTTGDESSAAEMLMGKFAKLKNTIRSNSRNGLLPQAEAQRRELEETLEEMDLLRGQIEMLQQQQQQEESRLKSLRNHRQGLRYQTYLVSKSRLEQARAEARTLQEQTYILQAQCDGLLSQEELLALREEVRHLQQRRTALYAELTGMQEFPEEPEELFGERDPDRLDRKIKLDRKAREDCLRELAEKKRILWPYALVLLITGAGLCVWSWVAGAAAGVLGLGLLVYGLAADRRRREKDLKLHLVLEDIRNTYGSDDPDLWQRMADAYRQRLCRYERALHMAKESRAQHTEQMAEVNRLLHRLTDGMEPEDFTAKINEQIGLWGRLEQIRREWERMSAHVDALGELPKVDPPAQNDEMTFSLEETERLIRESDLRIRSLESRIRTLEGRIEGMGNSEILKEKIRELTEKIAGLEQTLEAIELARKTLEDSTQELQRRFAPGLTKRASELFCAMTDGRYRRLRMDRELTMLCAAEGEAVLRSVLWRSDGTADQLYLALRLALWEELAPECPLIMDDAMVRFDDGRLKQAMKVLKNLGEDRQILLLTCQSREKSFLETL